MRVPSARECSITFSVVTAAFASCCSLFVKFTYLHLSWVRRAYTHTYNCYPYFWIYLSSPGYILIRCMYIFQKCIFFTFALRATRKCMFALSFVNSKYMPFLCKMQIMHLHKNKLIYAEVTEKLWQYMHNEWKFKLNLCSDIWKDKEYDI